jgi:hypothetical protein
MEMQRKLSRSVEQCQRLTQSLSDTTDERRLEPVKMQKENKNCADIRK